MPLKTYLILRRSQGGRLEGRTIVTQPAFQSFHTLPRGGDDNQMCRRRTRLGVKKEAAEVGGLSVPAVGRFSGRIRFSRSAAVLTSQHKARLD
jgi:hypothetical protein